MISPVLTAAATASLETAINTALRYDPGTRIGLQKLAGQSLAIDLTAPLALTLGITFANDHISISHQPHTPTTRLRGSLAGLASLMLGEHSSLAGSGVEAIGSTVLLTEVQRLLRQLDLDWEDLLADCFGDIAAHQAAQRLRPGLQWLRQRGGNSRRLLSEFLTEELQATPGRHELELFHQSVDELRLRVDRADARLRQLQQLVAARATKKE